MDIDKFEKILNSTVLPAGLVESEQEKILAPLISFMEGKIPTKLFKYRRFSTNHLDAFFKDQVWVSTAQNMNDGFDSRLFFDKNKCIDLFMQQSSSDRVSEFIENMKTDSSFRETASKLPGAGMALQYLSLPTNYIVQGIDEAKKRITPTIIEMLENLPAITQQTVTFCCFSGTVRSASMWGQYSDNESGFCIEYDFSNSKNKYIAPSGIAISTSLYPIIYKKNRFQVPESFINYLIQYRLFFINAIYSGEYTNEREIKAQIDSVLKCPDLLMATKTSLYKSIEWQFEQEWRLFCTIVNNESNSQPFSGSIIKVPKAVYLGRRVSDTNEKIMRMLAKEKKIPVYKMKLSDDNPTYELTF